MTDATLCFHIYTGGSGGGVMGVRCARPESEHCQGSHRDRSSHSDPCAGVHHMFIRRALNGCFRVTMRGSVFGLVVEDGIVTAAAQIAGWAIGKPWEHARRWFAEKGGKTERMQS